MPSIWVSRVNGSVPLPYPGKEEFQLTMPELQSVNVNVSVPQGVCVRSFELKFGGKAAPDKMIAGKVIVLLFVS